MGLATNCWLSWLLYIDIQLLLCNIDLQITFVSKIVEELVLNLSVVFKGGSDSKTRHKF